MHTIPLTGTCKKLMQHVINAMPSRHMSSQAGHSSAHAYMQLCATCISAKNDCPKPSKHTHQTSTTWSHCWQQATDPQLCSISCSKHTLSEHVADASTENTSKWCRGSTIISRLRSSAEVTSTNDPLPLCTRKDDHAVECQKQAPDRG